MKTQLKWILGLILSLSTPVLHAEKLELRDYLMMALEDDNDEIRYWEISLSPALAPHYQLLYNFAVDAKGSRAFKALNEGPFLSNLEKFAKQNALDVEELFTGRAFPFLVTEILEAAALTSQAMGLKDVGKNEKASELEAKAKLLPRMDSKFATFVKSLNTKNWKIIQLANSDDLDSDALVIPRDEEEEEDDFSELHPPRKGKKTPREPESFKVQGRRDLEEEYYYADIEKRVSLGKLGQLRASLYGIAEKGDAGASGRVEFDLGKKIFGGTLNIGIEASHSNMYPQYQFRDWDVSLNFPW